MALKLKKNYKQWFFLIPLALFILDYFLIMTGIIKPIDNFVYQLLQILINERVTPIVIMVTHLGSFIGIIGAICVAFIISKRIALVCLAASFIQQLLNRIIKFIVKRPRPSVVHLVNETNYSFPSGHAMAITCLYGLFIYYLYHSKLKYRKLLIDRICNSLNKLDGAFAFLILIENALYVARDKYGLRPVSIGQLPNGAYVFSSETCAFEVVGAKFVRDLEPGEIVRVKDGQIKSKLYTNDVTDKICAMEYIYFSRPDSNLDGINVHTTRKLAGKQLFKEAPVEADLVIGVPDSSISAAIGYAEAANIPYEMGLIKNKYVGRTFIQPTQEMREQGVRMKLSAVSSIVKGKRVVMIDDSIVRGTTSKRIVRLLKEAGAREVHVRIASPAIKYPCFYGVDMSTMDELISNRLNVNELCNYIEADSLAFITEEGIDKSIHFNKEKHKCSLCLACFNGEYVTNLYDSFEMDKIKKGKEY